MNYANFRNNILRQRSEVTDRSNQTSKVLKSDLNRNSIDSCFFINKMKIKSKVTSERVGKVVLENELKKCQGKLDGFGHELKIVLAEINIIAGWISEKFGVVLIDKASLPLKQSEYNEIEEISAHISSFKTANVIRKAAATTNKAKKSNQRSYDNELFSTERNTESQFASDDSLQETFEDGGSNDSTITVSKNKRGRPKKHDISKNNFKSKTESKSAANSKRGRPKKTKPTVEIIENIEQTSTCEECGKVLKDSGSLRQHKLIHQNLKPYPCPDCGKCFRRNFHLKTHRLIHAGIKKHQCGYCGKLFLLPKDLIAHERTHTGEKPFSCTTCPKSFNLKSHLVMHIRTHTGEKPYKCDVCDKTFSQSNSLRVHKKVHQRERTTTMQIAASLKGEQPSAQNVIIIDDSSPVINESHLHDHEEMVSLLSRSNAVYSSMSVPISNLVTFGLMPMPAKQNEQSVSNSPLIEHQHQINDQERVSLGFDGQNKVTHEQDQVMHRVELLNTISVKTEQINIKESEKNQEQHRNESETTQNYDDVTEILGFLQS